jgi:hypothetical protein
MRDVEQIVDIVTANAAMADKSRKVGDKKQPAG